MGSSQLKIAFWQGFNDALDKRAANATNGGGGMNGGGNGGGNGGMDGDGGTEPPAPAPTPKPDRHRHHIGGYVYSRCGHLSGDCYWSSKKGRCVCRKK